MHKKSYFYFSLRLKLALVLAIIFLIMGCSGALITEYILRENALQIEQGLVNDNINRVKNIFIEEINLLKIMVKDWAFWDDTADFVVNKNPTYIEKNLYNDAFISNKWSYFLIFDLNKKFVYGKGYDVIQKNEITIPKNIFSDYFYKNSPFFQFKNTKEAIGGLIIANGQLQFVSSILIKRSDQSGQYGYLVFMRPLTNESIETFSKNLQLPLTINYLNKNNSLLTRSFLNKGINIQIYKQTIQVKLLVNNIHNKPIAILSFEIDRKVYKHSEKSIDFFLIFLGLTGLISLSVLWFFINFIIIKRIRSFNKQIINVAKDKNYSKQINIVGEDELTSMAEQVNFLLNVIQKSYKDLQKRNQTLQQLELEKRNIITYTPEPIIITDHEDKITMINNATEKVFACDFEELKNKNLNKFFILIGKNSKGIMEEIKISQFNNNDTKTEYQISYKDKTLPVELKTASLSNKHTIYLLRDISERKKYEIELAKLNQKIMLASRQAGMSDAITMLLHNIGNILSSAVTSLALIEESLFKSQIDQLIKVRNLLKDHSRNLIFYLTEDQTGKKLPDYIVLLADHCQSEIKDIKNQIREISEKINQVMLIIKNSKFQDRHLIIEKIDLIELCNSVIEFFINRINEIGIYIEKNYIELEYIQQDRYKLWHILTNLFSNAIESVQEKKSLAKINITIEKINTDIFIKILDNGIGIEDKKLTEIFSSHSIKNKTAMGLHSSALLAKEIGGSISVYSEGLGKGATFILQFPSQIRKKASE